MPTLIYISIGIIIGLIGYKFIFGGKKEDKERPETVVITEKEDKENKIFDLLKEKGKITNNDVEELLSVADSTATKYLQRLENEGKLKQIGQTGSGVYYMKN